jgi:hypothetical protein
VPTDTNAISIEPKPHQSEPEDLAERPPSVAGASAGCMVLAAAVRQDGPMATTVTEGEPRESRTSSATSIRWQRKLATFAETHEPLIKNVPAVRARLLDRIRERLEIVIRLRSDASA